MSHFVDEVRFTVRIHEEDGSLWAEVVQMPGLFVSGESIDEIQEALTEAMSLYMTSKNVTVSYHDLRLEGPRRVEDADADAECWELVPA